MRRARSKLAAALAISGVVAPAIALLGGPSPPAAAGPRTGSVAITQLADASRHGFYRFNVAEPHSPQVERMLAGGVARPPGAASSSAHLVQGVDVADHQHPHGKAINWRQVARDGYKFAFIKVSEGSYYKNPYYRSDAARARAAGLYVAPYIFGIPNYSHGARQAAYGLDAANYKFGGRMLAPILDIEYDPYVKQDHTNMCYGLTRARMVRWISGFVTEIRSRTRHWPVFYTPTAWWRKCTGDSTAFRADPLWTVDVTNRKPNLPRAWHRWTYWQYAEDATVKGIDTPKDVDVDYASTSALKLAEPRVRSTPRQGRGDGHLARSRTASSLFAAGRFAPTTLSGNSQLNLI
jgi:GH25 family lysozyme M1 (1,4-beta-N-acetylmuramidase)